MVVVAVGAHHCHHVASGDGVFDGLGVMSGVDDDDLGAIADNPDIVIDFPTSAVEFEVSVGDDPLDAGLLRGH